MKLIYSFIIMSILLLNIDIVQGQPFPKSLTIGDEIPVALWNKPFQVLNYAGKKSTIKLNDYKGKLIILDFWATWCSSCISVMPKMHKLQDQFKEQLVILPVTYEEEGKTQAFVKKNKMLAPLKLTTVYGDTIFKKLFPHVILPHFVWISPQGKILATSSPDQVTPNNIQKAFGEAPLSVLKVDLDTKYPLFIRHELLKNVSLKHYSMLIKGKYDGLVSGQTEVKSPILYKTVTNLPLIEIYRNVVEHLFTIKGDTYDEKRLVLDVSNKSKLVRDYSKPDSLFADSNYYTYTIYLPTNQKTQLYNYMFDDLNRYSGYFGTIEKRTTKCFVLKRIDSLDKIKTKGGESINELFFNKKSQFRNSPISYLVGRINALDNIKIPVLNETNYVGNVDLDLSGSPDINTLKKELSTYGLELIEVERDINMFVLNDRPIYN